MFVQPLISFLRVIDTIIEHNVGANTNVSTSGNNSANQSPSIPIPSQSISQTPDSTDQSSVVPSPIYVSGIDPSQLNQVTVDTLGSNQAVIQGQILNAASSATLTLVGASGAKVAASGTYLLSGNSGQVVLNMVAGESLNTIAAGVNQVSAQIGITATINGDNLLLKSNDIGSNAMISMQPITSPTTAISGLDSAQVSDLNILAQTSGSSDAIIGTIDTSAQAAQLVYQGAPEGTVNANASFVLTGTRGSANITLNQGESLSAVAGRINQATLSTGVIASVSQNDLLLTSDTIGVAAKVQVSNVIQNTGISTTGVNSEQINNIDTKSIANGTQEVLSGTVLQSATGASIALQGSADSKIIDSATFHLAGSTGGAQISVQQGESLSDVAAQVNTLSDNTGVVAQVNSNQLVFQSVGVGSAAKVSVQLADITHTNVVAGLNDQPISDFSIDQLNAGASDTLFGIVNQAATQATLTLQGSSQGTVLDNASFQLTGTLGSANLSITQGQALSDVAHLVNSLTDSIGVVAHVVGNNLLFQSSDIGSAAHVAVQLTGITHTNVISGINNQQFSGLTINSLTTGASDILTGTIDQAATQATLTLQGSSQATVIDSASYQLTGALGSANLSITQGQTLTDVANQVNAVTASTGVVAHVVSNNLIFQSSDIGSAANVTVQLTNITHTNVISGLNHQQVSGFTINNLTTGASDTLTGTVDQAATQATLTLQGSAQGTVLDSASFQLTGALGSANLSITQGQALSDVANQVNALTNSTGVMANVIGNNLQFQSSDIGSAANVSVQLTNITHNNVVSGVNNQQVSGFTVNRLTTGASDTLSGTVEQAATQATLTLQGSSQGNVIDTATFQLTGALGSTNLSITQGQALTDVANQVNALAASTGVVAHVAGNNLVFQSSNVGSAANVAVQLTNITHTNVVSGVNHQQVSSFAINSLTTGASDILTGTVDQAATQATLTLQGSAQGTVIDTATFRLTGALGSTNLSITQGQALTDVANQVNALTNSTGVMANVVGTNLVFQSSNVGSAANVAVQLTDITHTNIVSGVNTQQLSNFTVNHLMTGASDTLTGTVDQTATQAALTLQGSSQGTVLNSATFQLTGSNGSANLSITQGQALTDVANQVNALTGSTGVIANVVGTNLQFQSSGVGSNANVSVHLSSIQFTNVVTGVNAQQISNFTVNNLAQGASETLTGQITHSATQAQVALQGAADGTVVDSNTFNVTGALGTAQITIQKGQTLSSVVSQVNALTNSTGVSASLSSNQVVFQSVNAGSAQSVALTLANVNHATTVIGVNANQVASFHVESFTTGASQTLSGTVTSAASNALLTFTGNNGNVNQNSSFTLTGSQGSAVFTTTLSQTLANLASQVNAATTTTGVQATVSGNTLKLQSVGLGSNSFVAVNATSGSFAVSGGNGNGSANGTNALAVINGQTILGTGNSFTYTDSKGTYTFTTAAGYAGAISPININQVDQLTGSSYTTTVMGVNSQQLTNVQATTSALGNSQTLTGTVTQTATNAQLTYSGTLGLISSSSTFTLTGSLGSATFTTSSLEALSTLVSQVNSATSTTGVQAVLSGSTLNLISTGVGSQASVAVKVTSGSFNTTGGFGNGTAAGTNAQAVINGQSLIGNGNAFQFSDAKGSYSFNTVAGFTGSISTVSVGQITQQTSAAYTTTITGVNAAQVADFHTHSFANGASQSITGTITKSATSAQLTFAGNAGTVHTNSTFTLTGSLGSASFTTTNSESLTTLATQINAATSSTGVQAIAAGNNLNLISTGVGRGANVGVNVTSGSFAVTGGFGNGTASGTDAQAILNGQSLTGNGNTFQFSDAVGTYSLTAASGYTGTINEISINSKVGQFNVTGGNGNGSANGTDAQAVINGKSLTGNGNAFQWSDNLGSYAFQSAAGYTGSLSAINISSQAGQFNIIGGNGNGSANGTDAHATINGQSVTGVGNAFEFSDAQGSYSFNTVSGFTGSLNAIHMVSQAGRFDITGGNGNSTANGTDAHATINGQSVTGVGNAFQYNDAKGSYSFSLANGFTGVLDLINIVSQAGQFNVTGGNGNSTANGSDAHATINSQSVTGVGNAFQFSDAKGSYAFNIVDGFVGTLHAININSQAGQFNVLGGNGNGTAHGTDAHATINGQSVNAVGNAFQFSDDKGSYAFNIIDGILGTLNAIHIDSQAGQFNVTGDNGTGTAHGTDAHATINGQSLTAVGNAFQFHDGHGSYTFSTVAGFQGSLNPIQVTSQAGQFNLVGGNGNGTANGTDAHAIIDGQSITGVGDAFQFTDSQGSYRFHIAPNFIGALNPVQVNSQAGQFQLIGGNGLGSASGTDAKAVINGMQINGTGDTLTYQNTKGTFSIQFVHGFNGAFDPIAIQSPSVFTISGGDGKGVSQGTDLAAKINGKSISSSNNTINVTTKLGKYRLTFANGFVGEFNPITITSNTNDESTGRVVHGSDAQAIINGIIQSGNGNTFNINYGDTKATLEFAPGFTGVINPITLSRSPINANQNNQSSPEMSSLSDQLLAAKIAYLSAETRMLQSMQMTNLAQYIINDLTAPLASDSTDQFSNSSEQEKQTSNRNEPGNDTSKSNSTRDYRWAYSSKPSGNQINYHS